MSSIRYHSITHFYDAAGRVTKTIDPSGQPTLYQYDAADRLIQLTDPLSGTLQYTYDTHSNLTKIVDPEGEVITHTYDSLGLDRLIRVTDSLNNFTQYQYDGAGRLVLRSDALGATTTFGYDGASRLITRTYSGGPQDLFTYDPGGRLTGMTDGSISSIINYDAGSRPITLTLSAPGFTGPTRAVYTYDAMGNRTRAQLLDSSAQTWQTDYQYDALGRLVKTTANSNINRAWITTYNAAGCRSQRTLPDGSYEVYTYDPGCRLIQLDHHKADNTLIRSFVYSYDSRGSLLTEQDGTQTSNYTYDALSRLINANTPEGASSHTFGPSGERLTTTGPGNLSTTYHYDAAGHLTSTNDTIYQYDAMGRRTSQTGPGGTRTLGYDGEMRLTTLVDPFANVSLDYDPLGQLVRKQGGPGGNTYYLNGTGRLEAELSANGALSRTYTIDTEIVALNLVGTGSFDYHYDGRGRVRWVTNGAGQTIAAYGTDPTVTHDNFYNPIRVIGSYYFPEFNLYLIGDGQFWDPWSGTFIFRAWPWVFWPFGPFSAWHAIFRYWPWPWLWPRPWAWPWPRPWAWQWPWAGVWVRPWLIWPLWPWPVQPFWPWWWWWHWWGWPAWGHWWVWQWWGWWGWWWNWAWWGSWWWPWWWWPWWWWWPCWWMWWAWWGWWGWWWWWGWCWWCWGWWWWWWGWWPWWWGWGWWWIPWYWVPYLPRPPDYGDAPDPAYPSLLAHNGARHLNPDYEWLGANRDREYDAKVPNLDAFDDGVVVNLSSGVITFTVNTAGYLFRYSAATPVHVHGWIDWNGDGDWNDAGELVLDWRGYPGGPGWTALASSTMVTATISVPAGLPPTIWARFRLDYNQDLASPVGPARYGEVEDYPLSNARHIYLPLVRR